MEEPKTCVDVAAGDMGQCQDLSCQIFSLAFAAPQIWAHLNHKPRAKTAFRVIYGRYEEAGAGEGSAIKQWFFRERPDFITKFFTWRSSTELQPVAA